LDGLFANPLHWGILIVVVLIIFGPGKLPGVGASLGKSLREFKKASAEDHTPGTAPQNSQFAISAPNLAAAAAGAMCEQCGLENPPGARFCGECGHSLVKIPEPVASNSAGTQADAPSPIREAPKPSVCADCRTENPAGNQFCAHCGRLIEPALGRV
jgi:sec-independent protein translocase protein TatA